MVLVWFMAETKHFHSSTVLILPVMHLFRLSLPTVLPSTPLRTIHLNPKAKSNTINILPLAPSLYQATRISKQADDG